MSIVPQFIREYRDEMVLKTLNNLALNRRTTATQLGVSLRTLLYWIADMRRRGIEVPKRG